MGGQSIPAATQQTTQAVTGWAAVPELKKRALGVIDPALSNIHNQQQMLLGFQGGDSNQTRKLFGLSPEASTADVINAIRLHTQGPQIAMPQSQTPQTSTPQVAQIGKAHGGIMSLDEDKSDPRKFAKGGSSVTQAQIQAALKSGVSQKTIANALKSGNISLAPTAKKSTATDTAAADAAAADTSAIRAEAAKQGLTPADAYFGRAGLFGTNITKDPTTGQDIFSVTNPYYNKAVDVLQGMGTTPSQFGSATTAYENAIAGLKDAAGYQAKDVTGTSLGPVANISAPEAVASSYNASQMAGPQNISAQGYDAAQMQAATMQGAQDIQANRLNQYQMDRDRIRNLQAQRAQVAEMTGPESWTQRGVAEKYMNPYVKTALASQQELANLDLQNQLNQIMGQAAGRGAFGGSKTQLALASARRNQDLANRNMAAQGLSQAYTQGMGQFTNEQQMSQAAKSANQAAANAANLDYVARQYAAEAANQGMDYNTALQNMQAKLGVQQAQQQADLAAAQANQMYGYGGFQSQAQNLASLNTTAANNMQAINSQRSQYVTQALQAAQANQQAQLTTEQQNMIARNAAAQFNADNATKISQANAQMNLAAQQSNQQVAYNTAAQNAQLAQQANLANQQAGLQANQQNIGALSQAANAAQGLGALGTSIGAYNTNLANLWGAAGSTLQGLGQGAYSQIQNNALGLVGGPTTLAGQGTGLLSGAGGTSGTKIGTTTPGSAFG